MEKLKRPVRKTSKPVKKPARKQVRRRSVSVTEAPKRAVRKRATVHPEIFINEAIIAPLPSGTPISGSTSHSQPQPVSEPTASGFVDRGLPLPESYGMDRLVPMVCNPELLFSYWELNGPRFNELKTLHGAEFLDSCAWVLRLYRLNHDEAEDMEIEPSAGNWYIHVAPSGKYQLELALLSPEGDWISLIFSDPIETPRDNLSDMMPNDDDDEEEEEYEHLPATQAAIELMEDRLRMFFRSSLPTSRGMLPTSGMLGASERLGASGKPFLGASAFLGASKISGSGGSGGLGWGTPLARPSGLERPMIGGGPNWNAQSELPKMTGKTALPHFKIKLPRILRGIRPMRLLSKDVDVASGKEKQNG